MSANELPPLAAIRVFEAAARHINFTKAAKELGMTQAAVSYQIKVLEDRVGAPLFIRQPRGVTLSDIGARLLPATKEAFDILGDAFATAKKTDEETLTISVGPTFAVNMLASKIGKFQVANPSISSRILMDEAMVDFSAQSIDVAIRSGRGDWPGLKSHRLIPAKFTPLLSRKLAETIGGLKTPADLKKLPLVGPKDPWWAIWFKAAGVSGDLNTEGLGGSMGSQVMEATAAMAGHGAAILTPVFYSDAVQQNQLFQPFDIVCEDQWAYWIVYPESRRNSIKIRAFRDWLLAETAQFRT